MKFLNEVLDNYNEIYRVLVEDRFGKRLCQFLTIDEMKRIGFTIDAKHSATHQPLEWTEENILKQLKEDVEFGYEKAVNQRGISSSLMYMVVLDWCKVLENEFANWTADNYGDYGKPLFIAVANKYGWALPSEQELLAEYESEENE